MPAPRTCSRVAACGEIDVVVRHPQVAGRPPVEERVADDAPLPVCDEVREGVRIVPRVAPLCSEVLGLDVQAGEARGLRLERPEQAIESGSGAEIAGAPAPDRDLGGSGWLDHRLADCGRELETEREAKPGVDQGVVGRRDEREVAPAALGQPAPGERCVQVAHDLGFVGPRRTPREVDDSSRVPKPPVRLDSADEVGDGNATS